MAPGVVWPLCRLKGESSPSPFSSSPGQTRACGRGRHGCMLKQIYKTAELPLQSEPADAPTAHHYTYTHRPGAARRTIRSSSGRSHHESLEESPSTASPGMSIIASTLRLRGLSFLRSTSPLPPFVSSCCSFFVSSQSKSAVPGDSGAVLTAESGGLPVPQLPDMLIEARGTRLVWFKAACKIQLLSSNFELGHDGVSFPPRHGQARTGQTTRRRVAPQGIVAAMSADELYKKAEKR